MDARSYTREMIERGPERGRAPIHDIGGEVFTFNDWREYQTVLKVNPDLAAPDGELRRKAWLRFARTDVGKAFRTR